MEYKAVIWDLDGTLYDKSRIALYLVLNQLPKGKLFMLGRERSMRKRMKGMEFGTEKAFYDTFFGMGISRKWYFEDYLPSMVKIIRKHYMVFPWVEELFRDLRSRGVKQAVLSDYGFVKEKLEAIGFEPSWADMLADAPSYGCLKPSPRPFLAIADALGVKPSECLVIGDRPDTDGEGAAAAGMDFVHLADIKTVPKI